MQDSIATSPPVITPKVKVRGRKSMVWLVLSALAIVATVVPQYLTSSLQEAAANHIGLAKVYAPRGPVIGTFFYLHIIFAGLALALGPFQFVRRIRTKHVRVHRATGRAYIVFVLIGATAGFVMSTVGSVNMSGFFGFGSLALLWGFTTVKAYQSIRARDFASHQAWMMRSFALTYAAVTLRLVFGALILVQAPFVQAGDFTIAVALVNAYAPLPYICWIPNLVVAEILIRRRGLPALRMTASKDADTTPRPLKAGHSQAELLKFWKTN